MICNTDNLTSRWVALTAALLLHAPVILLSLHSTDARVTENARAARNVPFIAQLFFLQDARAVEAEGFALIPTLEKLETINVPIPVLPELNAVASDSFEEAQQIESAADLEKVGQLQGIYTRQIADRITRVLQMRLAASRSGETRIPCIVHVIQNESGDVMDVDMAECPRPPDAREALAGAIRAASPLPPPPQGLAMGSYLTLDATLL